MSRIIGSAFDGLTLGMTAGVGIALYVGMNNSMMFFPLITVAPPICGTIGLVAGTISGISNAISEPEVSVQHIHHTYVTHEYDYGY